MTAVHIRATFKTPLMESKEDRLHSIVYSKANRAVLFQQHAFQLEVL